MTTVQALLALAVLIAASVVVLYTRRLWVFAFLFIVLFPKVPLAAVPGNTTPLRVDDIVLGLVLGGWLVRRALTVLSDPRPRSPISLPLILFLGVAFVATLVGIASETTAAASGVFHVGRLVQYALLYYFFYDSMASDEAPRALRVVLFAWQMVALVWIVQHWTLGGPAAAGPMGNWNTYAPMFSASYDFGGYLMMTTLVLYAAWVYGPDRRFPILLGLLLALGVAVNSDSRASLVGVVGVMAVDILLRWRLKTALALFAVAAAVPFVLQSEKMEKLLTVLATLDSAAISREFMNDPSIALRLQNWDAALERWSQAPFFGDGLGSYLQYVRQYNLPGTPDGWYIRTLAETGLVGLFSFMLLVGAIAWVLLRAGRLDTRPAARTFLYGGALVTFAACINAFFIDTFVSFKMMGTYWMLIGLGTRLAADQAAAAADWAPRALVDSEPLGEPL